MSANHHEAVAPSIDGVLLASFLQLLEQERKTCTLVVTQQGDAGRLHLCDGNLVDAEAPGLSGIDAAYEVLSWENPTFHITVAEARVPKITESLMRIIFTAATRKDEQLELQRDSRHNKPGNHSNHSNQNRTDQNQGSVLTGIGERLSRVEGVKDYLLMNTHGRILHNSASIDRKLGDFVSYCAMNGTQVRDALGASRLQNIRLRLPDNEILLVVPGKSITIGLVLAEKASIPEVFRGLRQALFIKSARPTR